MARRAPLQGGVLLPLDRGESLGVELGLLILQEVQVQSLDGQVRVLLEGLEGVRTGVEGVHEHQRQTGAELLAGRQHLGGDDVEE